jgi:hypothetical protein
MSSGEHGNTLDDWTETVLGALDLPASVDRDLILDMAREVAHGVARPAAPLTAYVLGLAVGAGADPVSSAARVVDLAQKWPTPPAGPGNT